MHRIVIGLALAGLASLAPAHAQQQASEVYQWKDASGTTHYSQTPPPKGAFQARKITHTGSAAPAATTASASATASATAAASRESSKECVQARANVTALQGKGPVSQDTDGDGKADAALDESQRAGQLNLAQAAVQAYCTP